MTAGNAIETADQLRPGNAFSEELKQAWLRQCDARLRQSVVERAACGDFDAGETARAVNELQMYSDSVQEFAAWMRRRYAPAGGAQWRY